MSGQIRAGAFRVAFSDVDGDVLEFERNSNGMYAFTAYYRDSDNESVMAVVVFSLEQIVELRDVLNQAIATDAATWGAERERRDDERVARARAEREAADAAALRRVNERLRLENDELRKQGRT